MGSKKRKKPAKRRQGLSGNPAVRAEQLDQERMLSGGPGAFLDALGEDLDPDELRGLLDDMSRVLEGNPKPSEWWPESFERVLERARAADWPADPAGIEETTCAIIGAQLTDNFAAHETGHHNTPWLLALTGHVEALLEEPGDDWRPLWALLRGLVLTMPFDVLGEQGIDGATALTARGLAEGEWPVPEAIPAGTPLIAKDTYGCRFLVAAPFGYAEGETDHWYAWDVDACWLTIVVAAGTFGSAEEALAEWRGAVGAPAAGTNFGPESGPGGARLTGLLLSHCLDSSPVMDMPEGGEPDELLREYFRSRHRAQALRTEGMIIPAAEGPADGAEVRTRKIRDEFRQWHADRAGTRGAKVAQAAETIIGEWGPQQFLGEDDLFRGCSPHRVEYAAHMISNGYLEDYADRALRLLPDWVQWCASRGGLSDEDTSRAVDAARTAAEVAEAKGANAIPDPAGEGGTFRRTE